MGVIWLLVFCCAILGVNGNFTVSSPMKAGDINCLTSNQCEFFPENQTLALINISDPRQAVVGVAYYSEPVRMKDPATNTMASFSTSFTFREEPMFYNASPNATMEQRVLFKRGDGFTFFISNSSTWKGEPAGRFGIFDLVPESNFRVVALEFDSWSSNDTDLGLDQEEHVGLDVHSAISESSCFAYVYRTLGLTFWHRDVLYAWIDYDGVTSNLQVRLANTSSKPTAPLINCKYNLYDAVNEKMWVGFSGSHGDAWSIYYIWNWSFTSYGIPTEFSAEPSTNVALIAGVAAGGVVMAILAVLVAIWVRRRKQRLRDESFDTSEMVEMAGMPEFISYKHLSAATKQFSDQSKLGEGGFGSVYRGVLPKTGAQVAVKKVSNDSKQGEREFLAEVQIISQLRHRNIVELIGFCRDRGKFLLVYELMPRGSLDQALFKPKSEVLPWNLRWKIVSGTAAALHYLHEGWRQQVIHRDVKSSNIMLDDEYNPKLGDFGLARLVDHEKNAATTMVAGTYGFIAPEAAGGKFTDKTDVYAFGAVALELCCGRRAYDPNFENYEDHVLLNIVWGRLKEDNLLSVADPLLGNQFDAEQMAIVLRLGLLCSHPDPGARPTMRQVVQVLAGDADVPDVPSSRPDASSYLRKNMPHISIDDLLNSRSGTHSGKRPVSSTSLASSSSFSKSDASLVTTPTSPVGTFERSPRAWYSS